LCPVIHTGQPLPAKKTTGRSNQAAGDCSPVNGDDEGDRDRQNRRAVGSVVKVLLCFPRYIGEGITRLKGDGKKIFSLSCSDRTAAATLGFQVS
jgi:hypothetical protein